MQGFFDHQHRRLGILLAWGLGSAATGVLAAANRDPFSRNYGLQAAAWGAIDAALAFFGRRGARESAARQVFGEISEQEVDTAARGFRRILLINSGLDVGYVLAGALLAQRAKTPGRRGMGAGIVVQGLFLLIYDGILAYEISRDLGE